MAVSSLNPCNYDLPSERDMNLRPLPQEPYAIMQKKKQQPYAIVFFRGHHGLCSAL